MTCLRVYRVYVNIKHNTKFLHSLLRKKEIEIETLGGGSLSHERGGDGKKRPIWTWPKLFLALAETNRDHFKTQTNIYF